MQEERRALVERAAEFAVHGKKFEKAIATVLTGGVKEARFSPSGRRVISVLGTLGDEFIDPEKPYCSCGNFYFRVTRGKEDLCYHLISYKIAHAAQRTDIIAFSDDEYGDYLRALIADVFEVLDRDG